MTMFVFRMLTWVERYDKASVEAKHMIIAALVDSIGIGENDEVRFQFKVSAEQFIQLTARAVRRDAERAAPFFVDINPLIC